MRRIAAAVLGCVVVGCAPQAQPSEVPASAGSASAQGGEPPPSAPVAPAPAASEEPAGPKPRPLDLTNTCPRPMHLYFGPSPGDPRGQSTTVPSGATVAVPRSPDGTVTVWIVDENGRGLASVAVRRRMTHVQIDAACSRIDTM